MYPLDPLQLIRRPKIAGPGLHYGIRYGPAGRISLRDRVVDFGVGGVRRTDLEGFAEGRPVELLEATASTEHLAAHERLTKLLLWPPPYDLISQNCEDVARWVMTGRTHLGQVEIVSLATLLALIVAGDTRES